MSSGRRQYPFHLIEPKWQRVWVTQQIFRAWNPGEEIPASHPFAQRHTLSGRTSADKLPPKFYILDMFPYPSGAGLHVGHPEGYTATDILARYRRAQGFHVLHPMGWDAFGLPAEQHAVRTGQHPRVTTQGSIANFKRQIQALGFSYDWTREVDTTDPNYFKWTQWIFLQLYNSWFNPATNQAEPIATLPYPAELKSEAERRAYRDSKRLAYVAEMPVWWCEELGTVLANEEVIDGKSEVGGFPVVRRPMRQWMLRITAYAERLLNDLDQLEWSESLKEMQRNWIGRSEGAEVDFKIAECGVRSAGCDRRIRVFTTRPDTLFGATYMVLSPEHKLVEQITTTECREAVKKYQAFAAGKSDLERTDLAKEKTGVFTGAYAINPVNGERIPIWIADYVLISYGTGAIMAVPGHDTRDLEFARKFDLPVRVVVQAPAGKDSVGYVDDGIGMNSANAEVSLNGLPTPEAKQVITQWLEQKGLGKRTINYKLRDWLFSRQRYWGEPFPILWRKDSSGQWHHEALPESALPLVPPPLEDYKPTPDGQPPLARAKDWVHLPDGSVRETNTMPQWAGSCWYYLRYLEARRDQSFCGILAEHYWMGTPTEGLLLSPNQWATRLRALFDWAVHSHSNAKRYVTYATVGPVQARSIEQATGLDVRGYRRFIDSFAVRHILREHGREETEARRGSIPITFADFLLIPEILENPDRVSSAGKTGTGLDAILYEKQMNGCLCCVEEVRQGHNLLAVKTLYKRKATASHASEGLSQTSETLRRSEANKAPSNRGVKPTAGVDLYVGGAEHAVLHLLYARFWHKVLYDLGHVSTPEPFRKLVNQGLILGEMEYTVFADAGGQPVSAADLRDIDEEATPQGPRLAGIHKASGTKLYGERISEDDVEKRGDGFVLRSNPALRVDARCVKMSKSRGNVINPDHILADYGADAFRLYEMFLGPLEMVKPWSTKGVEGVYRFLGRVWRLFVDEQSETEFEQGCTAEPSRAAELLEAIKLNSSIRTAEPTPAQLKTLHACIKKVTEDLEGLRFNTAISALMVFVNEAMTWPVKPGSVLRDFLILLHPFAPHLAEELWAKLHSALGTPHSALAYAPWPKFDPALLVEATLEIPVQLNGKLRDVITVPADATAEQLQAAALASEKLQAFLAGLTIKKLIVVPKKLVNIVAG